ncbi:hypothetical protein B0H16DRAFT_1316145 [Mycena metata]|uniref:SWIM-type domain-containing protein n=1 Tax=Mycena metata TaxID=1033252 RepID=A0AAD7J5G9_9AGAR|nr:hypothetical protein B0H16DRAFT_1338486 [Mycena metata]KAJ7754895.1 hypothetical protein B0H16DRAFT_1316145 [Mycena metata]
MSYLLPNNCKIRVEVENRITEVFSVPKKSLFQVFTALNDRTKEQQRDENIRALFKPILDLLRTHAGPFALQTCFKQMEFSMYYEAAVLQRPEGVRDWRARNDFANDNAYIGTRFLLRLVPEQGIVPSYLIKITHTETGVVHIIALLPDGRYTCNCYMGNNLGVVCRHFFLAWVKIPGLPFHISLIRKRCELKHLLYSI